MKKNKLDRHFEAEMQKAIKEKRALKHTRVMEIRFMDKSDSHAATGTLSIDQHGKYWIDRNRPVLPFEIVEWYAHAHFNPSIATDIDYCELNHLHTIFLETVQFVKNTLKGGAK
jgi:hypothetical protein